MDADEETEDAPEQMADAVNDESADEARETDEAVDEVEIDDRPVRAQLH
jgi:hypothetical protein